MQWPHLPQDRRRSARTGLRTFSAVVVAALLAAFGALAAGCAGAPRAARSTAAAPSEPGFTILQINDTYKIEGLRGGAIGGMGRVRALRQRLESEGRPVLVLHAGDFLFPSVMSKFLNGAPMVDALDRLDGSDAFDDRLFVTFGNHEFDHQDPQVLFDRIAQSRFTWISSNVRVAAADGKSFEPFGRRFPNVVDHVVLDLAGIRVGIFGLTLDDQRRPWIAYDYAPEKRRAVVARVLGELERAGAELVIALTHQEIGEDEALAREFGDRIDWIVGGHEHVYLRRQVGTTTITKADADAKSAVRIDVRRRGGQVVASATRLDLDSTMPVDPEMAGQVAASLVRLEREVEAKTGRKLLDVVATTEHLLEGTEPAIRGRETALGDFLCDTLRQALAADVAFVNGGAIRVNDDVPAGGNLRVYELEGIFYYDDKPVVTKVTGRELLDLLRISVSQADLGHGRFLQVAGLRFRYHLAPGAAPRVEAAEVTVAPWGGAGFEPLDLDRAYRVATLDYMWHNGYRDGYPLFSTGNGKTSPELLATPSESWREITERALAALPDHRIRTTEDGRITRVD